MGELVWQWRSEELVFLPQRALWRPQGRELLLADLHLGKAEAFQAHGIPIPSDADSGTLNPLLELCHRWQPRRVLVLGDRIHARVGLTPRLRDTLRALPDLSGAEVILIGGIMTATVGSKACLSNPHWPWASSGSVMLQRRRPA